MRGLMHALVVSSGDREFGILALHFEGLPVAPNEIRRVLPICVAWDNCRCIWYRDFFNQKSVHDF